LRLDRDEVLNAVVVVFLAISVGLAALQRYVASIMAMLAALVLLSIRRCSRAGTQ